MTVEIEQLSRKIDEQTSNQHQINERLTKSIEEVSHAISDMKAFQVEVNNVRDDVKDCQAEIKSIRTEISNISTSVEINKQVVDEFKWVKRTGLGIIVATILSGGYLATNATNYQDELIKKQAEILSKITDKLEEK